MVQKEYGGIAGGNFKKNYIENCYNIGMINGTGENIGSIAGACDGSFNNCYYLENKVNGTNGNTVEGTSLKTSEELKNSASSLGVDFKEDAKKINNGYPILKWQWKYKEYYNDVMSKYKSVKVNIKLIKKYKISTKC